MQATAGSGSAWVRVRAGVGGKALFFFQVGCGTLASGQVTGPVKGCVHSIAFLNVGRGVLAARFG